MSDEPPLIILPYGRTAEDEAKLERKKARGRRGLMWLCVQLGAILAVMLAILAAGRH